MSNQKQFILTWRNYMNEIDAVENMFALKTDRRCGSRRVIDVEGNVSYGLKEDGTPRKKPGRKVGIAIEPQVIEANNDANNGGDDDVPTIEAITQKRIDEIKKAGYIGWVHKELQKDVVKLSGHTRKVIRGTIGERHILGMSPHPIKYYLLEGMNVKEYAKLTDNPKKIYGLEHGYYGGIDVFDDANIEQQYETIKPYDENDYHWAGRSAMREKVLSHLPIKDEQWFLTFPSRQGLDARKFNDRSKNAKIVCIEHDRNVMAYWKAYNSKHIATEDHECDILDYVRLRALNAPRFDLINFDGPIYDTESSTEALQIINQKKMGKLVAISMSYVKKFRNVQVYQNGELAWAGKMNQKYAGAADRSKQLQIDTMSNYDLIEGTITISPPNFSAEGNGGEIIWKKAGHTKQWMRTLVFKLKAGI